MTQQRPFECTVELRGDVYVTVDPGGSCHPTTGWELYLWQAARAAPALDPKMREILNCARVVETHEEMRAKARAAPAQPAIDLTLDDASDKLGGK
jgi:hypothetical protein